MFLDSLGAALDRLEDHDVSMAEPEPDVEENMRHDPETKAHPPAAQGSLAAAPQVKLIDPQPSAPLALGPQSPSPNHLWPTALGAHAATHLELKMPIPPPWHENIYYTVSTYIHLLFKGCVLGVALWVFALLVRDVNTRIGSAVAREMAISAQCSEDFVLNGCQDPTPALVQPCRDLEMCMDRDPLARVFRLSALAQSLAETLNSFTDPLSPKSMALLAVALGVFIYFTNFAFGFVRARAIHEQPAQATLIYK